MKCSQCGVPLPPDVGFCRACGAFVRPRSATPSGLTTPGPSQVAAVEPSTTWQAQPVSHQLPVASGVTWAPGTLTSRAAPFGPPSTPSMAGDVLAAVGSGLVLISIFLTWYSVTLTALGVQFYESLEQAFLSRLFPQIANSLAGISGPLTFSVPLLGSGAGGWRWAILVVSVLLLLEVLLAIASSAKSHLPPSWPHGSVLLLLSVGELVLVLVAFFSLPYGSAPSTYLTVAPGVGAYVGLVAALLACGGAVVGLAKSSPGSTR